MFVSDLERRHERAGGAVIRTGYRARQYSRLTRAAGAAIGPYVYVKQKLRGLTRSFELAAEHREG
jgi:hypothetical protein